MATRVGEIYAELTLDDTRFQRSLDSAERGFTGLRGAAERAAGQIDRSFSNTGSNIERGGLGARNAARDIDRVGDSARDAARDVDRIERSAGQAASATRRIDLPAGLSQAASRAADALGNLGQRASGMASTGSSMGDSFVGGFAGKLQGLGGKGGPIAMALVGVASVGLAAGAVLADAISDGMQMEKDRDFIQARLGVSDETMRIIGTAAGNAFSNGWGESVNANMETIQDGIKGGLFNGEESSAELQPLVEKITAVNDLIGGDMEATIKATRALIRNGLAADTSEAFDLIVKSYQRGADAGGDMLDVIGEYSNGWKNTGFTGKFAMGLITQALENGVDVADRAGDAIREFGRRMTEEPDKIKEAITGLSLPADELFDQLKEGGATGEAAFDKIFDAIRDIKDPLERNQVTMALLGDTAGDFIDTFGQWDPSRAVAGLGDVAGAAEKAMVTMGDNAASHLQAAQNSITMSMDDVKLALGEAFGPTLAKVADWVSTHKPEIISFFTGLADAGLACLDGLITFTSGALRAFASMQEGIGNALGVVLKGLGGFGEKLGGIIKHIPGMEDAGKAIEGAGSATKLYGDMVDGAADKARALADTLDSAKPKIDGIRESVRNAGQQAADSAELTRLFGGAVDAIPDEKDLIVKALTEEAKAKLEAFGYKVENLPDGTTKVTANTADAQRILDAFIAQNNGKKITTYTTNEIRDVAIQATKNAGLDPSKGVVPGPYIMPDGTARADGGVDLARYADGNLPGAAEIKPATGQLVQWAEPETGGEAFIPLAASKRSRSTAILADVAKRFGYDLLRFAEGGITPATVQQSDLAEATEYARRMAGVRYELGGFAPDKMDCSGFVSAVINEAMGLNAYDSRMSTASEGSWLTGLGAQLGKGAAGTLRVGWTTNGAAGGHTAGTFPDGTNFESNGSDGVVIGGKTGADDPMFTDHAFFPLGGDLGGAAGSPSKLDGKDGSGSPSSTTPVDSGATDGSRVFVTNWPDSLGGKPVERTPLASFQARFFADGSENHVAQIAKGGDMRVWAEPETGGEAYIPLSAAKRARSTDILRKVADRFGFSLSPFANGGFGGVGSSGDGGVHTGSWAVLTQGDQGDIPLSTPGKSAGLNGVLSDAYRAASFLAGSALALRSGWDDTGKFVGFDTGNTAIPGLDGQLETLGEKLDEIVAAAQKPNPVEVSVDIDTAARQANINITQLGL
ncbi:phage tail tape measure protein [Nocardia acidivorans]|uniref:phage tail tape measure protein n=1 Tax=Nocardia acidivorans TaxID=404580 RepID=UPI00082D5A55|nr:phage tail tape measure protein [Nocardia acidivorans]